jgi:hypothetical protein
VDFKGARVGSLDPKLYPSKSRRVIQESGNEPYQRDFWPLKPHMKAEKCQIYYTNGLEWPEIAMVRRVPGFLDPTGPTF